MKETSFDQLFQLPHNELQKFYNDLTIKHLASDFYQITADAMDPKQQSIIILEPAHIEQSTSQDIIYEIYQESISTINQLSPEYDYPTEIKDEHQPLIIFQETNTKDKEAVKVQQVIPFNLWLGFTLPVAIQNPHLLKEAMLKKIDPFIHLYAENLLINWLNLPWLIYYQLNHPDLSLNQILDHSLSQYQISLFDTGLNLDFDLNLKKDQEQFKNFLNSLNFPKVVKFGNSDHHLFQLQINR